MYEAVNNMLPGRSKPCPRPEEVLKIIDSHCGCYDQLNTFGSFSPSLYDTAWLSMVPTESGRDTRLFPQCLDAVLLAQQHDGTWPSYSSPTDGILISLVALLSLTTNHAQLPLPQSERKSFMERIERGKSGVKGLLQSWKVGNAVQVGFELLVISLIRRLENLAIEIKFPKRSELMQLYEQKIRKFSPELLYGSNQTTLLHSVEAFVGLIEFQRISHHCSEELGVFGSPAATAAYLIHSPEWDPKAEKYLQRTMIAYGNTGDVPSAFPTSLFEVTWAVSFMVSPIVETSALSSVPLSRIRKIISNVMCEQGNLVGFAPNILADADCTARNLLMLMRLRRLQYSSDQSRAFASCGDETAIDVAPFISTFEAAECFKTYDLERNPSFSANCNVVLALLEAELESEGRYDSQIEKVLRFLLDTFETGERDIIDKWNVSSGYSSMLFLELAVLALEQYDAGRLQAIAREIFVDCIPKTLHRMISQILAVQKSDGSWDHSVEVTSYNILAIAYALRLPWALSIRQYLIDRIGLAKLFLATDYPKKTEEDYLWIEKTTYQSSLLRTTYCSLALHTTVEKENLTLGTIEAFKQLDSKTSAMDRLFSSLPLLQKVPKPVMELILMESKYDARILATGKFSILPANDPSAKKNKYLEYIPVIWLLCNHISSDVLSAGVITEMLRLSQVTFQIDAYMETTIAGISQEQTNVLETWINRECSKTDSVGHENGSESQRIDFPENDNSNGDGIPSSNTKDESHALTSIQITLGNFLRYVLRHNAVKRSSPLIQKFLATELSEYLLAHMRQNRDNAWLKKSRESNPQASAPFQRSYFSWARSTGADHSSCPFAFRFFMCIMTQSDTVRSVFESAQAQYLSSSVSRHLATLCRQYNDCGSISRDAAENNLNSVDFAEFHADSWNLKEVNGMQSSNGESSTRHVDTPTARQDVIAIAEFERKLMEHSFEALKNVVHSPQVINGLRALVNVTDLFGQLYVAKDVGIRKRNAEDISR